MMAITAMEWSATGSFKDATASIIFSQNQNNDILKM
jgi:hypothetical protein